MRFSINRKVKWLTIIAVTVVILVSISAWPRSTAAAPVAVRFMEGVFHGFLILRTDDGVPIAFGYLRQVGSAGTIKSHMSFRFKDGSLLDETTTYSADRVFTMQKYHLLQRGPTFGEDLDATLDRSSESYHVKTRDHEKRKDDEFTGTVDF